RALPCGAGRARGRVLHPGRIEGRQPPAVPCQLQVVALAVHPDGDVTDAGPRVEPGAQRPERAIVGEHRAASEADCRTEELTAFDPTSCFYRNVTQIDLVPPPHPPTNKKLSQEKTVSGARR